MSDDPDDWVLDDAFVRAGRHEPAARTRDAIARHGGQRTSWRQPGDPEGASSPPRRRRRAGRTPRRSRGRTLLVLAAYLFAFGALGAWVWSSQRGDEVRDAAPVVRSTSPAAGTTTAVGDAVVSGVPLTAGAGSCYATDPADVPVDGTHGATFRAVDCGRPHRVELVGRRQAQGGAAYPAEAYWSGPVAAACRAQLAAYAGGAVPVRGRDAALLRPTRSGWAQGDRHVACLAVTVGPVTGSVRAGR